jgi:hypothetical protein
MMTKRGTLAGLCAGAALLAGASGAAAQLFREPLREVVADRVHLGCAIELEKVVLVTNTTAGTIPAGTEIFINSVIVPTRENRTISVRTAALSPGESFREGLWQSYSCTAWFRRVPMMAPAP